MKSRAFFGLVCLLCACSEHPAAKTVRGYNEALVRAYRESDPAPLSAWATEPEKNRVLVLIDLKKANRLVLECELPEVTVRKVDQVNPEMAIVETDELWIYHDRAIDPGVGPKPRFKVRMHMQWEVVQEGGVYRVDKGRTLSSEHLEPKDAPAANEGHGGKP